MGPMHEHEVATDAGLVRRLVREQFPAWGDLEVRAVELSGTDNALYRLGDDLVVRLPRVPTGAAQVDRDRDWLPRLRDHLPISIPVPVARGAPGDGFPFPWAVHEWIEGEQATVERLEIDSATADLGSFLRALQAVDIDGGPRSANPGRGVPLAWRDEATEAAVVRIERLGGLGLDVDAIRATWSRSLAAPPVSGRHRWIHADLHSGNLLARDGRVVAVIDWGCMGVGDPAYDLVPAWMVFPPSARAGFRDAAGADADAWQRAAGVALSCSVVAVPYYWRSNPDFAAQCCRTIEAVLADPEVAA